MIAPDYVMWGLFVDGELTLISSDPRDLVWEGHKTAGEEVKVHQLNVFVAERKENNDDC